VRGESFPAVLRTGSEQDTVEGLVIEDLLPRELRALDFYEDEGTCAGAAITTIRTLSHNNSGATCPSRRRLRSTSGARVDRRWRGRAGDAVRVANGEGP